MMCKASILGVFVMATIALSIGMAGHQALAEDAPTTPTQEEESSAESLPSYVVDHDAVEEKLAMLQKWTRHALSEIFNYGFNNLEERRENRRQFFTEDGYEKFALAMARSRTEELVMKDQVIVRPEVLCAPKVELSSPTMAIADTAIRLTYFQDDQKHDQYLTLKAVIDTRDNPLIKQIIAAEGDKTIRNCDEKSRKAAKIMKLKEDLEFYKGMQKKIEEEIRTLESE